MNQKLFFHAASLFLFFKSIGCYKSISTRCLGEEYGWPSIDLESPGFSRGTYAADVERTWIFVSPFATCIYLEFETVDLASDGGDFIDVFDAIRNTYGSHRRRISNDSTESDIRHPIKSTKNIIRIVFDSRAKAGKNGRGFRAHLKPVKCDREYARTSTIFRPKFNAICLGKKGKTLQFSAFRPRKTFHLLHNWLLVSDPLSCISITIQSKTSYLSK